MRAQAVILAAAWLAACSAERTEYHYRPDYVAINQGRPLEETYWRPDGTKVVITSKVPGMEIAPAANASEAPTTASAAVDERGVPKDAVLQIHTPDMVVETFMQGLRDQDYAALYDHLVSPQQRDRMGGARGREEFVKFCETNRRELMASAIRLVSAIRGNSAIITTVSGDMTRYQLPEADRGQFGYTILEVERAADGNLRLAGVR